MMTVVMKEMTSSNVCKIGRECDSRERMMREGKSGC